MASKKGNLIVGALGTVVYRVVHDKQVISGRVAAGKMKQTPATVLSGGMFGQASSLASAIKRSSRNKWFHSHMSQNLTSPLSTIFRRCVDLDTMTYTFGTNSFSELVGFDYNKKSKLVQRLSELPKVVLQEDKLIVTLPELKIPSQLNFPFKSFRCELAIGVSFFRLNKQLKSRTEKIQSVEFLKDEKTSAPMQLEFQVPAGCLCIVSLYLEYAIASAEGWSVINDKKFNPAGICAAIVTPGNYDPTTEKREWISYCKKP